MSVHPQPIGFDGLELDGRNIIEAIPDVTVSFEDSFGEGDRLVVRHLLTGTHKGTLMGIPPTDKTIMMSGTDIYRFVDGKIAEEWAQPDIFGLLQQLGALPTPAS
jgi:predicted ester cyclase